MGLMLPTYTTKATDELCRDIAKKSRGVAFMMMSGGKDSLLAWLQMRRYFTRIIPFHCATIPGAMYSGRYLDYLEYHFGTKILRLMGEDLKMAMVRYVYQDSPWECDAIDEAFKVSDYSKLDILEYLRMKFNLPRAWCGVGISQNDSIDRLIYCRKTGGRNESHKTFYPCFDWPKEELLRAIDESELCVAPEYKYTKRSMGGVPCAFYNKVMMEHFPQDWELTKKWYPLAEVKNVRSEMIEENYEKWQEQEAAKKVAENAAEREQRLEEENGTRETAGKGAEMEETSKEGVRVEGDGATVGEEEVEVLPLSGNEKEIEELEQLELWGRETEGGEQ